MFIDDLYQILLHPMAGANSPGYLFWSGVGGHTAVVLSVIANAIHRHVQGKNRGESA